MEYAKMAKNRIPTDFWEKSHMTDYPEPPEGIRVLKNGAGHNGAKITHGPGTFGPPVGTIQSSEDARRVVGARWEKRRIAAEQGMIEAAEKSAKISGYAPEDAVRLIIKRRTEIALKDDGHAGNQAAELVLKTSGSVPDRQQQQESGNTLTLRLNDDAIKAIAQTMIDAQKGPGGPVVDI